MGERGWIEETLSRGGDEMMVCMDGNWKWGLGGGILWVFEGWRINYGHVRYREDCMHTQTHCLLCGARDG